MPPDDLIRLRHMAEAARLAIGFCQGRQLLAHLLAVGGVDDTAAPGR